MSSKNTLNNGIEIGKEIINGMDTIKESIEKNKDNKEVLGVAYDLFNRGINMELNSYSNIIENGKDKIKVVLWNKLVENISLTGSLKTGLTKFTKMFSNIGDMFSTDEELSEESQEIGKGFIKIEGKLKDTPIGDLMTFLKGKIGGESFDIIKNINDLNKDKQEKLFNNIDGLENIFNHGLKEDEKLENKIIDLPKSEKSFSTFVTETIKNTNNRGKVLGRFKKIGDKILGLAEKFGFKDSLVSMLDMLYKIPGIGPILKMLFTPKIKASFDELGLNGPEGRSLSNLKKFIKNKENKDILGFNPSDKIIEDGDGKKLVDNPDKVKKDDLKTFYSKFNTYFENKIEKEGKIKDKIKITKQAKKIASKLITSDSFWKGILTGKKGEKLDKPLNKNEQILALIFNGLGGKNGINTLDKTDFLSKLNSINLEELVFSETEAKKAEEITKKENEEKEKIKLEKEIKYKKYNHNLEEYLKTNDNILDFKLGIKKEKNNYEFKKKEDNNKKEKKEELKENEIQEKVFFDFYDNIEKYNKKLKPEEKNKEIKLDKDFWLSILTGEESNGTKLSENNNLNLLYLKFKDKKNKKDFEGILKSLTTTKIASLSLGKDLEETKQIDDEKEKIKKETKVKVDTKVKEAINDPMTEQKIRSENEKNEKKKEQLKQEIESISKKIKNIEKEKLEINMKIEILTFDKNETKKLITNNKGKISKLENKIIEKSNIVKKDSFFSSTISKFFNLKTDEQEDIEIFKENKTKIENKNKQLEEKLEDINKNIIVEKTKLNDLERSDKENKKQLENKKEELKTLPPEMKKAK